MKQTTKPQIKSALRMLWLKSVERTEALKRDKYTCQNCFKKQSVKKGQEIKIQVHHKESIDIWDEIIEIIRKKLLCNSDKLETLCVECHENKKWK